MSWVRKLVRQGGTHLVTIPLRCVESMGVRAGQLMIVEQPFSGALIVRPVGEPDSPLPMDAVRSLGWAVGRVDVAEVARRFVLRKLDQGSMCTCCRQVVGGWEIVGGVVCDYCMAELSNVIRLRMDPSQLEMTLR